MSSNAYRYVGLVISTTSKNPCSRAQAGSSGWEPRINGFLGLLYVRMASNSMIGGSTPLTRCYGQRSMLRVYCLLFRHNPSITKQAVDSHSQVKSRLLLIEFC